MSIYYRSNIMHSFDVKGRLKMRKQNNANELNWEKNFQETQLYNKPSLLPKHPVSAYEKSFQVQTSYTHIPR